MYMEQQGRAEGVGTYTVIRPGGVTTEPGLGVDLLELSQGRAHNPHAKHLFVNFCTLIRR